MAQFADSEPGPQQLAEFRDLLTSLLCQLEPMLQTIAYEKLVGKTDAEVAEKLDISPRTVSRKLTQVRAVWRKQLNSSEI